MDAARGWMGRVVRRSLFATVAVIAMSIGVPATAGAFSTVSMFSESGDYIGGGQERFYHQGNGSVSLSGTAAQLTVSVSGGNRGDYFSMDFAAPPGKQLEQGKVYVGAQRASFREAERPGIDISGSGRGCNRQLGNFEVLDLATGPDGKVTRLGLVYEQHCEGGGPALFGEVRYGYGTPTQPAAIPTHMRWPATEVGAPASVQPITFLAWNAPTTITGTSLTGADAGHFSIRSDECSGKTLQPGQSCQVWAHFDPSAPGTRRAALHVTRAGGGITEVKLDGHAGGGRTRFTMDSDPGDYIGGGVKRAYTPANASIEIAGTRRRASVSVDGDDGSWWSGTFAVGSGDILAPGRTYANATRYPFNNDGNGLSVDGSGRGCNTLTGQFTVNEARFTPEGSLATLSLEYEQHCEGGQPALRGVVEFHAGDVTPPAPWMEPLEAGIWTPPPDTDAAPGAPSYDTLGAPTRVTPAGVVGRAGNPVARTTPAQLVLPASERAMCGFRIRGAKWRRGTGAADRVRASGGRDVVVLGGGADRGWAGAGADCVSGGAGNDRLDGGDGNDVIIGGTGADRLTGGAGRDLLICGSGRDLAYIGPGDRTRGCERVVRHRR